MKNIGTVGILNLLIFGSKYCFDYFVCKFFIFLSFCLQFSWLIKTSEKSRNIGGLLGAFSLFRLLTTEYQPRLCEAALCKNPPICFIQKVFVESENLIPSKMVPLVRLCFKSKNGINQAMVFLPSKVGPRHFYSLMQ
jgi:hypothetical protein